MTFKRQIGLASGLLISGLAAPAAADTISPISYLNSSLGVGESVTIEKTVVIEASGPTSALIDVMFIFDTTGSMGGEIAAAKAAASDILTGISSFGDLASGTGFFNDPAFDGVVSDLTTNDATTIASINTFGASGGGDFPEQGNAAINDAALNASWRTGSNRFVVALGDASFKDNPDDATVKANLEAVEANLFGLAFNGASTAFETSVAELGGTSYESSDDPDSILADILDGISAGFATYDTVSIGDLGGASPLFEVVVECTGADSGVCSGSEAIGSFDRTVDRTFTFDVTFKRLAAGDASFETYALVDGGIVATESDRFPGGEMPAIPVPASLGFSLIGLAGLGLIRRRT